MPEQTERKYRLFRRKKSILAIDDKPANEEDTPATPSKSPSASPSSKNHTGSRLSPFRSKPPSPLPSPTSHQPSTFKFRGLKSLLHSNPDNNKSSKRKSPKAAITDGRVSPASSTQSSPSPSVKKVKANNNDTDSTTSESSSILPSTPTKEIKKSPLAEVSNETTLADPSAVENKFKALSAEVNALTVEDPEASSKLSAAATEPKAVAQTTATTSPARSTTIAAPQLDKFSVTSSLATNASDFKVQGLTSDGSNTNRSHISFNSSTDTTVVGDFDDDSHHDNLNKTHAQSFFGSKKLGTMTSSALRSQDEEEQEDQLETLSSLDVKNNVNDEEDDESIVDITHFSNRPNKKSYPNDMASSAGYSWLLIATTTTAVVVTSGVMAYRTFNR